LYNIPFTLPVCIFCTQLYQEVLALPDVDNCRYYSSPCPCGSHEQRSKCCSEKYIVPYIGDTNDIDPRAFLWKYGYALTINIDLIYTYIMS